MLMFHASYSLEATLTHNDLRISMDININININTQRSKNEAAAQVSMDSRLDMKVWLLLRHGSEGKEVDMKVWLLSKHSIDAL